MSKMNIITNNHYRDFVYRIDVPFDVLNNKFDYLHEDVADGFFYYKNDWYHTSELMMILIIHNSFGKNWDAYLSDTYFSGILIKLSDDMESIKIGRYYS